MFKADIGYLIDKQKTEDEKKKWLVYSFDILKKVVDLDEYIQYTTAEEIRRHLQPYIEDTTLY